MCFVSANRIKQRLIWERGLGHGCDQVSVTNCSHCQGSNKSAFTQTISASRRHWLLTAHFPCPCPPPPPHPPALTYTLASVWAVSFQVKEKLLTKHMQIPSQGPVCPTSKPTVPCANWGWLSIYFFGSLRLRLLGRKEPRLKVWGQDEVTFSNYFTFVSLHFPLYDKGRWTLCWVIVKVKWE